jgi:hypothetical protein
MTGFHRNELRKNRNESAPKRRKTGILKLISGLEEFETSAKSSQFKWLSSQIKGKTSGKRGSI